MKKYRVIVTPNAEECLLEIAEFIALDNPVKAFSFIKELTNSLKKTLSIFPFSGRVYEEIAGEEIRRFSYQNYTSYYRVNTVKNTVEILFIFNGKRQVNEFLESIKHT